MKYPQQARVGTVDGEDSGFVWLGDAGDVSGFVSQKVISRDILNL